MKKFKDKVINERFTSLLSIQGTFQNKEDLKVSGAKIEIPLIFIEVSKQKKILAELASVVKKYQIINKKFSPPLSIQRAFRSKEDQKVLGAKIEIPLFFVQASKQEKMLSELAAVIRKYPV